MKTVFVSSTVWDLADIRSEVYEYLSRNGYRPLMSEKDGFLDDLQQDGSYEKCRKAVEACDVFLMIINNRYGGSRSPNAGEISITHQELRWAVEYRRDFMCFIRDKVEADMKTWKDNGKNTAVTLGSVRGEKNLKIFDLIEEIQTSAIDGGALWWRPFSDSVHLKRQIGTKLGISDFSNHYLAQAQMAQALPRLTYNINSGTTERDGRIKNSVYVENIGSGAAVDIEVLLLEGQTLLTGKRIKSLPAGKPIPFDLVFSMPVAIEPSRISRVSIRYKNILANAFETEYTCDFSNNSTVPQYVETYFGEPR